MARINVNLHIPPFFTIVIEGIQTELPWRRATGRFLTLRDGSMVSCREVIEGAISSLPTGAEAWILVQPGQEAGYWPQRGLSAGQTSFKAPAQFGGSETKDIGEEFFLLLMLASKKASDEFRFFQSNHTKESTRGLRELPKGTRTLDRVRVIRR